jgi:hypothetical protein
MLDVMTATPRVQLSKATMIPMLWWRRHTERKAFCEYGKLFDGKTVTKMVTTGNFLLDVNALYVTK